MENDCVIVPGLGGFVTHYVPASRVEEEARFVPPSRVIGFNPKLTMNDGLLVQSYMDVYGTSFPDADSRVSQAVEELLSVLHDAGSAELPGVGQLHCSIGGVYGFTPFDSRVVTPSLYGFGSFEMQELAARPDSPVLSVMSQEAEELPVRTVTEEKLTESDTSRHRLHVRRLPVRHIRSIARHWGSIAAMIAVVLGSLLISTPIGNTEVVEANYACLMPDALFASMEKQALTLSTVTLPEALAATPHSSTPEKKSEKTSSEKRTGKNTENASGKSAEKVSAKKVSEKNTGKMSEKEKGSARTITVKEVKVAARPATTASGNAPAGKSQTAPVSATVASSSYYHIIIGSVGSAKDAEEMAHRLIKEGHLGARSIIGDGRNRVSIRSYANEAEAAKALKEIRQNAAYREAWILKR